MGYLGCNQSHNSKYIRQLHYCNFIKIYYVIDILWKLVEIIILLWGNINSYFGRI